MCVRAEDLCGAGLEEDHGYPEAQRQPRLCVCVTRISRSPAPAAPDAAHTSHQDEQTDETDSLLLVCSLTIAYTPRRADRRDGSLQPSTGGHVRDTNGTLRRAAAAATSGVGCCGGQPTRWARCSRHTRPAVAHQPIGADWPRLLWPPTDETGPLWPARRPRRVAPTPHQQTASTRSCT